MSKIATDKLLDKYIFDSMQFFLIKKNDEIVLRHHYYRGSEGEVIKELPLSGIRVVGIEGFIKGLEGDAIPITFELRDDDDSWKFEVRKVTKSGLYQASFTAPYTWFSRSFKGNKKDLLRFAIALSNAA